MQEDGNIQLEGIEKYDTVKDYSVIQVQTITEDIQVKLATVRYGQYEDNLGVFGNTYIDIETGKQICHLDQSETGATSILSSESLKDYLIAFDKVKDFYTPEDIEEILSLLEEHYMKCDDEKVKELIK